jgi:hypothetical protein
MLSRDALMRTYRRYHAPTDMPCPKCGWLMRLIVIEPSRSVQGVDEITYHSGTCHHEDREDRAATHSKPMNIDVMRHATMIKYARRAIFESHFLEIRAGMTHL